MSVERKNNFGKVFERMAVFCLVISITGLRSPNTGSCMDPMILNNIFHYRAVRYWNIVLVDLSVC
jgi:hypothetical protein